MALATAMLSIKLTSAMVRATGSKLWMLENATDGTPKAGNPPGTSPTIFTPISVIEKPQTARIPTTTATRGPGRFACIFLDILISTIPPIPIPRAARLVWPALAMALNKISCTWCDFGKSTPIRCLSWLNPMIKAAAEVNPLTTGWDRKFTRNPSLKTPKPN